MWLISKDLRARKPSVSSRSAGQFSAKKAKAERSATGLEPATGYPPHVFFPRYPGLTRTSPDGLASPMQIGGRDATRTRSRDGYAAPLPSFYVGIGFPSPPRDGFPRRNDRFAKRGGGNNRETHGFDSNARLAVLSRVQLRCWRPGDSTERSHRRSSDRRYAD